LQAETFLVRRINKEKLT